MSSLVTLADVKDWLGITDTASDARLTRLITAASAAVENYVNYPFLTGSRTEVRDGQGMDRMMLQNWPVTAVASLSIGGTAVTAATTPTGTGFRFDDTMLYLNGYLFTAGFQNVQISYTSGYATLPDDVTQAVILTVQDMVGPQGRDMQIQSYSVPGVYSESYRGLDRKSSLPDVAAALLQNYIRRAPI